MFYCCVFYIGERGSCLRSHETAALGMGQGQGVLSAHMTQFCVGSVSVHLLAYYLGLGASAVAGAVKLYLVQAERGLLLLLLECTDTGT